MRVAHINLSTELRGGEIQTLALAQGLTSRLDQRLILRRGSRLLERAAQTRGCQIRPVGNSFTAAARAIEGCDLVHVHDTRGIKAGVLGLILGRRPFVITRRHLKPPNDGALRRWCYQRAAGLVGVSNAVSQALQNYVGNHRQVETIYDGVKMPAPDALGVIRKREQRFIVALVGELDEAVMGHDTLLAAARILNKPYPDIAFWIIGRGKDEAKLRARAAGLSNVRFGGWMTDMGSGYRNMDVLVQPSREEAFGNVVLEAMSFGIPVIGSRVGGIPELIRCGHNGTLIDIDDGEGMAEAIVRLHDDPELRQRQSHHAQCSAAQFSVTLMAQQYAALYHQLLAVQPGRSADHQPMDLT